jgi:hypothetical protein
MSKYIILAKNSTSGKLEEINTVDDYKDAKIIAKQIKKENKLLAHEVIIKEQAK